MQHTHSHNHTKSNNFLHTMPDVGLSAKNVQNMYKHVQNMYKTCTKNVQNMYKICTKQWSDLYCPSLTIWARKLDSTLTTILVSPRSGRNSLSYPLVRHVTHFVDPLIQLYLLYHDNNIISFYEIVTFKALYTGLDIEQIYQLTRNT